MELTSIVEALLFSANGALSSKAMTDAIRAVAGESGEEGMDELAKVTPAKIEEAVQTLVDSYREQGRAFTLTERASGWRICALPEFADWSRALFPAARPSRLSPPALETLAIVAYRQPVTKASMEAVRGVSVDGVLQTLMDRNLIRISGRSDLPGRPLLYETTDLFLEHFGIRAVEDLPNSAELRQVAFPETEPPAGETAADQPAEAEVHTIPIRDASQTTPLNQPESAEHASPQRGEDAGDNGEETESRTAASPGPGEEEPAESTTPR